MIKIVGNEVISGEFPEAGCYTKGKLIVGKIFPYITRWWRAYCAEKYISPAERLLDIGCGDGYFLRRCKCNERFGLDKLLGDEIKDKLNFSDSYFDCVTMLAVIEHLSDPRNIIKEICRVLKPNGKLIITTPRKNADLVLRIYVKNIHIEHSTYFDTDKLKKLTDGMFEIVTCKKFMWGLNQVFVLIRCEK